MSKAKEEQPAAPAYESLRLPNLRQQRYVLATGAEGMTHDELTAKAAEIGIDVSGARTKAEAVEMVKAANTTTVATTTPNEG